MAQIKEYARHQVENGIDAQTSGALAVFKDNAAGLTPLEVAQIYESEYKRQSEAHRSNSSPLGFDIQAGLIIALTVLLAISQEWLRDLFKSVAHKIANRIYGRWSGTRLFRKVALKNYQKALEKAHKQIGITFRPNRPLDMVDIYVPIKATLPIALSSTSAPASVSALSRPIARIFDTKDVPKSSGGSEEVGLAEAVVKFSRVMLTGSPGSGKSMFLRYLTLSYAQGNLARLPNLTPVLVELHRLNETALSLQEQIAREFERNNFPHAERYIERNLETGRLLLLLDGLDEVNNDSGARARAVVEIKDLMKKHPDCRVIITCREAVYRGEFNDIADAVLTLSEFQDQQIRRFLVAWAPQMPADKSVDQLMNTLDDNPRIKSLARNPLLLTIIAYLYSDTSYRLPHYRSEFYAQATDILLRQWHQERNKFEARDKQQVLQHLGLFFQDTGGESRGDRRSIGYKVVLAEVEKLLPELNLKSEGAAKAIIDEIVQRSGLLMAIDHGEMYQFAHLTLQEYFAAAALRDDQEGLIRRFGLEPDTWRETVRLWCGLSANSTKLIEAAYLSDRVLAFECLAEAQKVNSGSADRIVEEFKKALFEANLPNREAVERAFGAVASDIRQRDEEVWNFLSGALASTANREIAMSIARALAYTNLPAAAKLLEQYRSGFPEIVEPLVKMGDIAVPPLAQQIKTQPDGFDFDRGPLDILRAIGTPKAAWTLVDLIWENIPDSSQSSKPVPILARVQRTYAAAWHLAGMLTRLSSEELPEANVEVEEELRRYPLTADYKRLPRLDWVWEAFSRQEPAGSALPTIASRIAYLIASTPWEALDKVDPQTFLDPRIITPIVISASPRLTEYTMDEIAATRLKELINHACVFIENLKDEEVQLQLRVPKWSKYTHYSGAQDMVRNFTRAASRVLLPSNNPTEVINVGGWWNWTPYFAVNISDQVWRAIQENFLAHCLGFTSASRLVHRIIERLPRDAQFALLWGVVGSVPPPTLEDWQRLSMKADPSWVLAFQGRRLRLLAIMLPMMLGFYAIFFVSSGLNLTMWEPIWNWYSLIGMSTVIIVVFTALLSLEYLRRLLAGKRSRVGRRVGTIRLSRVSLSLILWENAGYLCLILLTGIAWGWLAMGAIGLLLLVARALLMLYDYRIGGRNNSYFRSVSYLLTSGVIESPDSR